MIQKYYGYLGLFDIDGVKKAGLQKRDYGTEYFSLEDLVDIKLTSKVEDPPFRHKFVESASLKENPEQVLELGDRVLLGMAKMALQEDLKLKMAQESMALVAA